MAPKKRRRHEIRKLSRADKLDIRWIIRHYTMQPTVIRKREFRWCLGGTKQSKRAYEVNKYQNVDID